MTFLIGKEMTGGYGGANILHSCTIGAEKGEITVVVGPNGAGKSTAMKAVFGMLELSKGEVRMDGADISSLKPQERVHKGMGFVPQNSNVFTSLTVEENLEMGAFIRRDDFSDTMSQGFDLFPVLKEKRKQPAGELSGGQRQRVAIGRAIVRDPKVYLFDEPLSNLDAALRVATRIEIAQLKESMPESTMIYVTHDQVEAMTLASRIVLLTPGGRIGQVGKPLELYTRPQNEFVAQFIGSPAMNLLPGEVVGTGEQTTIKLDTGGVAVSAAPTRSSEEGLKVNVGVRPEDLVETDGDYIFEGKVSITEELGEVTLLHFDRVQDKDTMLAKLPGIHTGLRGNTVKLTAEPSKIHVFHEGVSLYYR